MQTKMWRFLPDVKVPTKKTAEEKRDADIKYETEMVEEIVKEGDIVPGTSYVNAELEMERMFFE